MAAGGSTRDIVVDVTIRSDTKGAKQGAEALGDIDKAAGSAGASMRGMEADSKSLTEQITKSRESVKGLEAELTKVGNNPGLRKALRVERSWLAELEKIQKALPGGGQPTTRRLLGGLLGSVVETTADATAAGVKVGSALAGGIGSGLDASGPIIKTSMTGLLIGAVVVASPFIGAAIAGAVVGGVGLGGIAGGVVAAAQDDRVKAAWKDFADGLTKESFGSEAFVEPVIGSIKILKTGLDSLHLDEVLGRGADAVPKLAAGLVGFAQGVLPGLTAALDHADEYADIFAEGLADVGGEVGNMIKDFAESEGAMDGLRATFELTADAISFLSGTVTLLGDTFHYATIGTAEIGDALADVTSVIPPLSDYVQQNADKMRGWSGEMVGAGESVGELHHYMPPLTEDLVDQALRAGDLTEAWRLLHGEMVSMDERLLDAQEEVERVGRTFDDGTRSLQGNSQAVLENRVALEHSAQAAILAAEMNLKQGGTMESATAILRDMAKATLDATGATGKQREEIEKFIESLFKLPPVKDVYLRIFEKYIPDSSPGGSRINKNANWEDDLYGVEGRASGGPVMAGVPYTINERGYETVTFPAGGTVHPANLTPAASRGGVTLTILPGGSGPFVDAMVELFRNFVRIEGGGIVQNALGAA